MIEIQQGRTVCRRCVLPDSPPDITVDAEGLCSVCREAQSSKSQPEDELLESDFTRLLQKHKGRHKYDCLVMCSGGKDSTASLYYMKKRYHLNPLAFTFDHGFETEDALRNVHKAVETPVRSQTRGHWQRGLNRRGSGPLKARSELHPTGERGPQARWAHVHSVKHGRTPGYVVLSDSGPRTRASADIPGASMFGCPTWGAEVATAGAG